MSLRAEGIVAGYTDVNILHDINLTVANGSITGIIGPNGAGKSTLLKTLYGFLKPKKGSVMLDGRDISRIPPHKKPLIGLSYIPQERSIFPYLTVKENLLLGGWTRRRNRDEIESGLKDVLDKFPHLKNKLDKKAGDMSGGEQKMLEIARALIIKPKILFVDEPSFGLAPKIVLDVYRKLSELNEEEKITILLVDQNVRYVVDLSHYIYIIDMGTIRAEGPKEEFQERLYDIVKEWLHV